MVKNHCGHVLNICGSKAVSFTHCKISDNVFGGTLISIEGCDTVFDSCEITGNSDDPNMPEKSYFLRNDFTEVDRITFKNTKIIGNKFDLPIPPYSLVSLVNCTVEQNSFPICNTGLEIPQSSSASPAIKKITVSSAKEFIKALGSNRKIILKPGVYDLSSVTQTSRSDGTVVWKSVDDGKELNLIGLSNLTIEGSGRDKTEIRVTPRYAHVLYFKGCSGVTVSNLKAGHKPEPYRCNAGVLGFEASSNISIGSYLYGCGSIGIGLFDCKNVITSKTVITQCSLTAVYIRGTRNACFKECELIKNNAYNSIADIYQSAVSFVGCTISGNTKLKYALFEIDDCDVALDSCKISGNSGIDGYSPCFINCLSLGYNRVIFRECSITGNNFYQLQKPDVLSFFEGCVYKQNTFTITNRNEL